MCVCNGDKCVGVNAMNKLLHLLELALVYDRVNHVDIGFAVETLCLDKGDTTLDFTINSLSQLVRF